MNFPKFIFFWILIIKFYYKKLKIIKISNFILFKKENGKLVNVTDKFRQNTVNNWNSVIIK